MLENHLIRVRGFEKISKEQWVEDTKFLIDDYGVNNWSFEDMQNELNTPRRATKKSSGYDFYAPYGFTLTPEGSIKIPTGIKAYMQDNEELLIFPRSSVGFKYKVKIDNTIGKIDADYYQNEGNEGHIWVKFTNTGDKNWVVNQGDAIMQGTFYSYLIADNDEPVNEERVGGIGSTNKN